MTRAKRRAGCILSGLAFAFFTFVSHAAVQPPRPVFPTPGIVSWWPGDGNANDIADGNNGTLLGGVAFSTAVVGDGFSFNSDADGVTIPHNPNLDVMSPGFSADFWMMGAKNQPGDPTRTIFEKSHGFVDATGWAFQVDNAAGFPRFAIGDGTTFHEVTGFVDVLDGRFHHVAGVWDVSTIRLYVDGVPVANGPFNSTPANNTRNVNIGFTWGGGTPDRFFRGIVDELQIFNRALSQSEIQAIFLAASAGKDADNDGVPDNQDNCPNSNVNPTVIIGGCDSGVPNTVFPNGCTISDRVQQCAASAQNHGQFVSCVAHLTNELRKAGVISGQQKGAIQSCAAQADIP